MRPSRPFAGALQALETPRNTRRLPYKEEVAGSSPASPARKSRTGMRLTQNRDDALQIAGGLYTSPVHHRHGHGRSEYRAKPTLR